MVISVNCIPLEEIRDIEEGYNRAKEEIRNRNSSVVITKGEEEESSNDSLLKFYLTQIID